MLVLSKFLRLFVQTLTDVEKYCLLYRDNLTQPNPILLSQKQKTFSELFAAFLKSTLNFAHFSKNDDPHSQCISQIIVSEKGDSINVCNIPFKRSLQQKTWQKDPKFVEICITLPLPCYFVPVHIIQLEKVHVSDMQNLKTVC